MIRWPGYAIYQVELKSRFRGWGIILVMALYMLALMSLLAVGMWVSLQNQQWSGGIQGEDIFLVLLGAQFVLLCVIGPLSSCAGISMEHERKSFELIITTLLRPFDICTGKLASAMALGWILFACGFPFIFFCTFIGGVSPSLFLCGYAFLLVVFISYCSFALWISCLIGRTMTSMIVVVVVLGILNAFFPVAYEIIANMDVFNDSLVQYGMYWLVMIMSPLLFVEGWLTDAAVLSHNALFSGYTWEIIYLAFCFYFLFLGLTCALTVRGLDYPRD